MRRQVLVREVHGAGAGHVPQRSVYRGLGCEIWECATQVVQAAQQQVEHLCGTKQRG
jgi:hypothetical protein